MRIKTVEISDDVAAVLGRATWGGNVLHLPEGQLGRALYVASDKVLRALGGRWNKGQGGHIFPSSMVQEMAQALESGSIVDQKKTLEQFFTPADLAGRMVGELDICEGMHVLEPSAGNGRLIWEALNRGALVTAVEIDEALCRELTKGYDAHHGDLFIFKSDFIEWRPASAIPIDRVIMNPPFSNNQDIAHVRRAFEFLRPGGKLAAIMSPHFTFADDRPSREFRELIAYEAPGGRQADRYLCGGDDPVTDAWVELLPAGTFKDVGTNIAAVLVLIEKAG